MVYDLCGLVSAVCYKPLRHPFLVAGVGALARSGGLALSITDTVSILPDIAFTLIYRATEH